MLTGLGKYSEAVGLRRYKKEHSCTKLKPGSASPQACESFKARYFPHNGKRSSGYAPFSIHLRCS